MSEERSIEVQKMAMLCVAYGPAWSFTDKVLDYLISSGVHGILFIEYY